MCPGRRSSTLRFRFHFHFHFHFHLNSIAIEVNKTTAMALHPQSEERSVDENQAISGSVSTTQKGDNCDNDQRADMTDKSVGDSQIDQSSSNESNINSVHQKDSKSVNFLPGLRDLSMNPDCFWASPVEPEDDCSQVIDLDTEEKTSRQLTTSPILSLSNEVMNSIFNAFDVDPKLPNLTVRAATPKCQELFRQTTRFSLWSLSSTCRALQLVSQQRLFSNIHNESGKRAGLLLRSLVEFPRLRAYVKQLDLRFSLDDGGECEDGLYGCLDLDLSKIPSFHASVVKRSGILDDKGAIRPGPVEDVFQTLIGLMLSLTTNLETLTLGFDVRHDRDYIDDTGNGVESFLSLFRGVDTTCEAIGGLLVSDNFVADNNTNDNTATKAMHHRQHQLLPCLRSLDMHHQKGCFDFIHSAVRPRLWPFNLPSLLALPSLLSLTTFSDTTQWGYLDEITWSEPFFALETLSFHHETMPGSALCCILRRCPNLRALEIDLDCDDPGPIDEYGGFRGSKETARISDAIPNSCPRLRSLTLLTKTNPRFFFRDEPNSDWLAGMAELTDLRTNVPCLFKDPGDMMTADICDRLPPNLERLSLDDIWTMDDRVSSLGHWIESGPDGYLLRDLNALDASAQPFAIMLSLLASSRMAGKLPSLRTVSVKSPIFEKDTGKSAQHLAEAFAVAGMKFEVIPFLVWPRPERIGVDAWSFRRAEKRRQPGRHIKWMEVNVDGMWCRMRIDRYREWQSEKRKTHVMG
ncbi:hypothetical protein CkaCkLH20_03418 [Colletotrichum karsti]|uniref:Uncharacterized protein n=1 Tax=Colletotrichum karsti TaxID=1095194 RepID=A0A9P6IAX1_9PEZI|nr:uncharacterized protein CkaCkLH20_03418 [Colletotrichum karsti]KAF9879185.1 hypothetical protein CkaCkLH20_03418 [Colletotrichum karsti]